MDTSTKFIRFKHAACKRFLENFKFVCMFYFEDFENLVRKLSTNETQRSTKLERNKK